MRAPHVPCQLRGHRKRHHAVDDVGGGAHDGGHDQVAAVPPETNCARPGQDAGLYQEASVWFLALWAEKWNIIWITIVAAVFSVFFALSRPDFYISTALLTPTDSSGYSNSLSSSLGGLAGLAGISMRPSMGAVDEVTLGLEVLNSRAFLTNFIEQRNLLIPLFAFKEWDKASGKNVLNDDVYDQSSGNWVGLDLIDSRPSMQEAFDEILGILSVVRDKKTGMIRVSITHQSPVLAQRWVGWLVG